jgi:predicted aldo/keto reductase-like oxidoreductase
MWHNTLGRTGLRVSALGLGSNRLRFYDRGVAEIVWNYALDRGISFFETGRMYDDGQTEEWIGQAIGHRRGEYVLASKCGARLSADEARRDLERSLTALRTDHLDAYRLAPVDSLEALEQALRPGGAQDGLDRARDEGLIGATGLTGHNHEVLIQAMETGRFDTVLFVAHMGLYNDAMRRLLATAQRLAVGTMIMRPLGHHVLRPNPALRFALASGADTVLCGMYSPQELDENLALAQEAPSAAERAALLAEARDLSSGCLRCGGDLRTVPCACPHGIDVRHIMEIGPFRARHGLIAYGEQEWSTAAEAARRCDDCGQCERGCVAHLSIIPSIHAAVATR